MVAKIGPAHGAHTTPNAKPVINPEKNPVEVLVVANFPLNLLTHPSKIPESAGTRRVRPKRAITTTANSLRIFVLMGIMAITEERKSVSKPKLNTIPMVIPKGFLYPPTVVDERIRGKSGQIHGAAIVIRPERKAKRKRRSITVSVTQISLERRERQNF